MSQVFSRKLLNDKKKQVLTDKNWARERTAAYQCLQHFAFHIFISDNFLQA